MRLKSWIILLTIGTLGCGVPESPPLSTPIPATPRPTPVPTPMPTFKTIRESLGVQKLVVVTPQNVPAETKLPMVVFFHGYTMDENQVLERTNFSKVVQPKGWILASSSLAGPSHWGNPKAIELHDVMVDYLVKKYGGDPEKLFLVGFSMGGGTALLAGIQGKVRPRAIASSQGWTNLSDMLLGKYGTPIRWAYDGLDLAQASLISQAEKLKGIPLYLEHGRFDQDVPFEQSENLHNVLESLGIPHTYRVFQSGHAESNIGVDEILKFFSATLDAPPP